MSLQKIKLNNGKIREVQEHLAFDKALQKQQGFVPCDNDGNPIADTITKEKKSTPQLNPVAPDNTPASQIQETEILEAHRKGASYVEIAKAHGLHWKKVEAIVKKADTTV